MAGKERNIVIAGASSDIGLALAKAWHKDSNIIGTYRTLSNNITAEKDTFSGLIECDFYNKSSIDKCTKKISAQIKGWDVLVMCPATMEPIGAFVDCDIDEWEKNISINFLGQMRFVHKLLKLRKKSSHLPIVLFFAGGGTNSAPLNFSGYTVSKIALIKTVELLDAEMPDVRFSIIGPGWVKTKIHEQTLKAGDIASNGAATITKNKIDNDNFVPMEKVVDCCNWIVSSPKSIVGGRNFSAANDFADTLFLAKTLEKSDDAFKLRRYGNDLLKN